MVPPWRPDRTTLPHRVNQGGEDTLAYGASPRAGIGLLAVARARAAMEGREFVLPDDIKQMAGPVLRHRLLLTPEAELDGMDADGVLDGIIDSTDVPG